MVTRMTGSNDGIPAQSNGSMQFALGKLEAMAGQNVKDINDLRVEVRGMIPEMRDMIKAEISSGITPLEKRLGSFETKLDDVSTTVSKWKIVLGVLAGIGGVAGYTIGNLKTLKTFVGGG